MSQQSLSLSGAGFRWIQQSQPAVSIGSIWDPSSRGQGSIQKVNKNSLHRVETLHISPDHRMLPALDTSTQGLCVMDVEWHVATMWNHFSVDHPVTLRLSPIARLLFNQLDDPVLEYQALTSLKLSLPLSHIVCGTSRSKRARRSSPIGRRLGECEAADSLAVSKVRETWHTMEWQGEGRQVPGCKMKMSIESWGMLPSFQWYWWMGLKV